MESTFISAHVSYYEMLKRNAEISQLNSSYLAELNSILENDYKSDYFYTNNFYIPQELDAYLYFQDLNPSTYTSKSNHNNLKEYFANYLYLMRRIRIMHVLTHNDDHTDYFLRYSDEMFRKNEILIQLILPLIGEVKNLIKSTYESNLNQTKFFSILLFACFTVIFAILSFYIFFNVSNKISRSLDSGLSTLGIIPPTVKAYIIESLVKTRNKKENED